MYVVAHLSDPHLSTPLHGPVGAFVNKRIFGYLSWRLSRSRIHLPRVLDALQKDLAEAGADHVVITGDIVNVSLPHEFEAAAAWISGFGTPADVTVVPGNHDAYVALPWSDSLFAWAEFMSADNPDGPPRPPRSGNDFPFVRRRGPVAFIGLSTALPSAPGMAHGRIGRDQLARLEAVLRALADDGCVRIVLLHHPPAGDATPRRKRLRDAAEFRRVIAAAGAELILHGHDHLFQHATIDGPDRPAHVFGVPSASSVGGGPLRVARYHLYRIDTGRAEPRIDVRARLFAPETGRFVEHDLGTLPLHASAIAATGADDTADATS